MNFQLDEIGDDLTYVGALYDLTEEFNVPVPEEDIQNYDVIMISIQKIIDLKIFNLINF